jgi:hypothetical protein
MNAKKIIESAVIQLDIKKRGESSNRPASTKQDAGCSQRNKPSSRGGRKSALIKRHDKHTVDTPYPLQRVAFFLTLRI